MMAEGGLVLARTACCRGRHGRRPRIGQAARVDARLDHPSTAPAGADRLRPDVSARGAACPVRSRCRAADDEHRVEQRLADRQHQADAGQTGDAMPTSMLILSRHRPAPAGARHVRADRQRQEVGCQKRSQASYGIAGHAVSRILVTGAEARPQIWIDASNSGCGSGVDVVEVPLTIWVASARAAVRVRLVDVSSASGRTSAPSRAPP